MPGRAELSMIPGPSAIQTEEIKERNKDVCDQIRVSGEGIDNLFKTENEDQHPMVKKPSSFDERRAYCANESAMLCHAAETSEIMK
jgi:hypothetical protein